MTFMNAMEECCVTERQKPSVVLLMGLRSSGKTTFIDAFMDSRNMLGRYSGSRSRTRDVQTSQQAELERYASGRSRKGKFAELPCFMDEPPYDSLTLVRIARFLMNDPDLDNGYTALYLHDFSPPKATSSSEDELARLKTQLKFLQKIFGKGFNSHMALVLNMYDRSTQYDPSRREAIIQSWREISPGDPDNIYEIDHDGDSIHLRSIIGQVLPDRLAVITLQKELLVEGKLLRDTAAGEHYKKNLLARIQAEKVKTDAARNNRGFRWRRHRSDVEKELEEELERWKHCNFPKPEKCAAGCKCHIQCIYTDDCNCGAH